jgi:hypothetical protein
MTLKLVCSWCHNTIREGALPASHGICAKCAERMEDELARAAASPVERPIEDAERPA